MSADSTDDFMQRTAVIMAEIAVAIERHQTEIRLARTPEESREALKNHVARSVALQVWKEILAERDRLKEIIRRGRPAGST
jgi:hypothetical protein